MPEFVCERLGDQHDVSGFACGKPSLDLWLRKDARHSDGRNITRTWIWHAGDDLVLAYYSLMPYLIERSTLTRKQARGLPDHIPSYLIARLALHDDQALRGRRLGSALLADALMRVLEHAREIGGRYVVVDAIDDEAASFYVHHGFEPVDSVEGRLLIPLKDIAAHFGLTV